MSLGHHVSPAFSPIIVRELESIGIFTVSDFLYEEPDIIVKATDKKLNHEQIEELRMKLLIHQTRFAPCDISGQSPFGGERKTLKSCIEDLDHLLGGGFSSGEIYELFGYPGSGKTQFALTLTTRAAEQGRNVLYFDTKNDFHISRLCEILNGQNIALEESLEKIRIAKCFELDELINNLRWGEENLRSKTSTFWNELGLIVIDSIAAIVLPLLGNEQNLKVVYDKVSKVNTSLTLLSKKHGVCVLVLNHATSRNDCVLPSLGKIFSSVATVRIHLAQLMINNVVEENKENLRKFLKEGDIETSEGAIGKIDACGFVSRDHSSFGMENQ